MASKITMFEPHVDGPLFGGDCDCECCGASDEPEDRHHSGADPRDARGPCAECPGRSIGLIALGVVVLAAFAVASGGGVATIRRRSRSLRRSEGGGTRRPTLPPRH